MIRRFDDVDHRRGDGDSETESPGRSGLIPRAASLPPRTNTAVRRLIKAPPRPVGTEPLTRAKKSLGGQSDRRERGQDFNKRFKNIVDATAPRSSDESPWGDRSIYSDEED